MVYSCFHAPSGLYDYFEDGLQVPVNADLPVPKLPKGNKVGVPAIHAGRPLPPDAAHVGRGWHARGMLVRCDGGTLSGFDLGGNAWKWIAGGAFAIWLLSR